MIDLTKDTDPTRNAKWWTRERFYIVQEQPTPRILQLGRFRLVRWKPRFFWSISWRINDQPPEHAGKFRAWQFYVGWGKCDATRTYRLWDGSLGEPGSGYVLTWTFTEMVALRKRDLDVVPVWSNMGGA
jgi:hypothetical protein